MFSETKSDETNANVLDAKTASVSQEEHPQKYSSIADAVAADMQSLAQGDPEETITVPMIHSTESTRLRDALIPFKSGRGKGKVTQTVIVRKMKRGHYLKHYAKDSEGNYVGTEKAAVDAGLVFVLSKNSREDMMAQVRKVAFGKEHRQDVFQVGYAMEYAGGYNKH